MNVVVACEMSGRVRDAFIAVGCKAISVDFASSETEGPHWQGYIFRFFELPADELVDHYVGGSSAYDTALDWCDLLIAHPPCDFLANSGERWFYHPDDTNKPEHQRRPHPDYPDRWKDCHEGVEFFKRLWELPIDRICIENPIPSRRLTRVVGKCTQIIQPHWFGDPFKKGTCLWLQNLPKLERQTHIPEEELKAACHEEPPGPMRKINRSRTYLGIAKVMAETWGTL